MNDNSQLSGPASLTRVIFENEMWYKKIKSGGLNLEQGGVTLSSTGVSLSWTRRDSGRSRSRLSRLHTMSVYYVFWLHKMFIEQLSIVQKECHFIGNSNLFCIQIFLKYYFRSCQWCISHAKKWSETFRLNQMKIWNIFILFKIISDSNIDTVSQIQQDNVIHLSLLKG